MIQKIIVSKIFLSVRKKAAFTKAVNERMKVKRQEYEEKGYSNCKKDVLNLPANVDERFIKAYQESYDKAQAELKEEYTKQGYEAAFTMLKYKDPSLPNEKATGWYKEGFESNNEIEKIKVAALRVKSVKSIKFPANTNKVKLSISTTTKWDIKKRKSKGTKNGSCRCRCGWSNRSWMIWQKILCGKEKGIVKEAHDVLIP
ncbi:hypothetical protein [Metabacillus sp. SLBN-84]